MKIEQKYLEALQKIINHVYDNTDDEEGGKWMRETVMNGSRGVMWDDESMDWNRSYLPFDDKILEFGKTMGIWYYVVLAKKLYSEMKRSLSIDER